ncbi:lipopolysaccharide heptosyltransferase family protein [Salegentibacter sp. BLCTC]|uniref:glycosyltransferase family 9 protein n=1 Tax=Salegentibacter sp. BLCTC TaxID=2697368 RepID=UPI00187B4CDD|nr:glycosyltransferase family 9 protein [Salegentibacter sp. BLCTC]MBE7640350.1 lipopolysaccharide heptosyltransferase family protein [Salegentibacter sp. BLCTC]
MKILIIQQKMIGDVLTSSILFEALRKKYPNAELHYLIYPHTKPVVENNPFIDKLIEYKPETGRNPLKFLKFLSFIRNESYSTIIDIYSKISSGIITYFAGAPRRLGFDKNYTRLFYTKTFSYKENPQTSAGLAIENRMQLLKGLDQSFPIALRPKIFISPKEKETFRKKLKKQGIDIDQPVIMCGVLGSSTTKSYPKAYMAFLLDKIVKQIPEAQILFNYLPMQNAEAKKIYNLCSPQTQSRIFLDIYENSLKGFIINAANCDLYFGNEGGAANIMKALGIPGFSIHSPIVKKNYWAIYEDNVKQVSIHLEDFEPHLFKNNTPRFSKLKNDRLYQKLNPELMELKLSEFLKNLNI